MALKRSPLHWQKRYHALSQTFQPIGPALNLVNNNKILL